MSTTIGRTFAGFACTSATHRWTRVAASIDSSPARRAPRGLRACREGTSGSDGCPRLLVALSRAGLSATLSAQLRRLRLRRPAAVCLSGPQPQSGGRGRWRDVGGLWPELGGQPPRPAPAAAQRSVPSEAIAAGVMAAGTASPEDKIVQSAVVRVVNATYEEEFHSNTRLMSVPTRCDG